VRTPFLVVLIPLCLIVALAPWGLFGWAPVDDAFITFRYASNLGHGDGFRFNVEDPALQGTSTPLFTLLCGLGAWLGRSPTDIASGLTILGSFAVYLFGLLLFRQGGKREEEGTGAFVGVAWILVLATLPQWVIVQISGMETMLFVGLAFGALWAATSGKSCATAVFAGLTVLTRYDGWALAIIAFTALFWQKCGPVVPGWVSGIRCLRCFRGVCTGGGAGGTTSLARSSSVIGRLSGEGEKHRSGPTRHLVFSGILFLLIQLPWVVYALTAFGQYTPHSIAAKRIIHARSLWEGLVTHIHYFLGNTPSLQGSHFHLYLLPLFLIGVIFLLLRRGPGLWALLWGLASVVGFSLSGVNLFKWYYMPALAVYSWVAVWGLWQLSVALTAQLAERAAASRGYRWRGALGTGLFLLVAGIWIIGQGSYILPDREEWPATLSATETAYIRAGNWVKSQEWSGRTILVGEVGAIAWSLPKFYVLDSSGINSPVVLQAREADRQRLIEAGVDLVPDEGSVEWVKALIESEKPGWIVSLRRFLHLDELMAAPWFQERYKLVNTIRNPPAQDAYVFRRND